MDRYYKVFDDMGYDGGFFKSVFDFMGLAEEVIADMKNEYPDREKEIHNAFKYLYPNRELFISITPVVYKHHCREIIERVLNKHPLNFGTSAEVLLVLHNMSFVHPLSQTYSFLIDRLFKEVMGLDAASMIKGDFDYILQEAYPGEADEIDTMLRRKIMRERA